MSHSPIPARLGRPAGRLVFVVSGLVLLAAAALKADQIGRDPAAGDPVFGSRAVAQAAVAGEAALGGCLVAGARPLAARAVAVACFGLFAAVSGWQAALGRPSCGCFGAVRVAPWATVALDLALGGLLAATRPLKVGWPAPWAAAGLTLSLAVIFWLAVQPPPPVGLTVSPTVVDLGALKVGGRAEVEVTVTNPTAAAVRVAAVRTSCPCLTVRLDPDPLPPGRSVRAAVEFDSAREPDFAGDLEVTAEGAGDDGRPVLRFAVRVRVTR